MDGAFEDEAAALIVVRAAVILPYVVLVDGRTEDELADVIQRLRIRVGDAMAAPGDRPLDEGNVQPVVVRVG
jgi:hypothetical protein